MSPDTPTGQTVSASTGTSASSSVHPCIATTAVLLAGRPSSVRGPSVSTALGIPTAALPINGHASLAALWIDALVAGGFRGEIVIAVANEEAASFHRHLESDADVSATVRVRVDTAQHRGAAGLVGDIARERPSPSGEAPDRGVIVIEASNTPPAGLAEFASRATADGDAIVGASVDGAPNGVYWLSSEAVGLIPGIGYFDLKEQLLPAIVASGRRIHAWICADEHHRVDELASYLEAVARLYDPQRTAHPTAAVEPGAEVRGNSVLCRGAVVEQGALVVDSVLLPGARVCADAVVARSVIPPGTHVPRGYLVVDEVFGALGSNARLATEGSAS
ncbi:MAG: hypothetical protein RL136_2347 [Planctomycetota bacterium]|jgi:hypothetical protein